MVAINAALLQSESEFKKQCNDPASYRVELDALRGIKSSIAPRLLGHDDSTMTLRLEPVGKPLAHLVSHDEHRFTFSQIRKVLGGLLQGLSELHAQRYCHYNVTPHNVCVVGDLAGDCNVKLIEYGAGFSLDRIPDSHKTKRVKDLACVSPEHLSCTPELGEAADVFCAGVAMLKVIRGGLDLFSPSRGDIESQIREAQAQVPTKTSWGEPIPGDVNLLLKSMLAVDPTYRRSKLCLTMLGSIE